MSHFIGSTCNVGADLQTILRELVAGVRQNLDAPSVASGERVHDIRVNIKKFRAIIRLAVAVLAPKTLSRANKLARKLKDHFASTRDNDILRKLLSDLFEESEALEIFNCLKVSADKIPATAKLDDAARDMCSRLAELTEQLDLSQLGMSDVLDAWVTAYRSARRMRKLCCKNKDDDLLFHECRKRVKELFYQACVLNDCPPAVLLLSQAEKLSSCLGDHHDLVVLSNRLSHHLKGSHAERIVRKRKKRIAREALEIGDDLFVEKPSALRNKINRVIA